MPASPAFARRDEVEAIALAEMARIAGSSPLRRRLSAVALALPAAALARSLVALDRDLAGASLQDAARAALRRYGVDLGHRSVVGAVPARGPLLVVANHPGLFDALALFSAVGRDDLATLAARRPLFDALPNLRRRLLAIDPGAGGLALQEARAHLHAGGAVLHFPAGRIEPDPRVAPRGAPLLGPWKPGLGLLLASAARDLPDLRVVVALVSGVISRRALALARALGRGGGITDALVPLIQLTLPGFGDAEVRVRFGTDQPPAAEGGPRLRAELEEMAGAAARGW
jgi:hypothetical protein